MMLRTENSLFASKSRRNYAPGCLGFKFTTHSLSQCRNINIPAIGLPTWPTTRASCQTNSPERCWQAKWGRINTCSQASEFSVYRRILFTVFSMAPHRYIHFFLRNCICICICIRSRLQGSRFDNPPHGIRLTPNLPPCKLPKCQEAQGWGPLGSPSSKLSSFLDRQSNHPRNRRHF